MYCHYQSLYYNDDGYVVRCKDCNHYQIAFSSTMLTLNDAEFKAFCNQVKNKCCEADFSLAKNSKSVVLQTPSHCICIILTRNEALRFYEILEEADNEARALSLLNLFNS